MQKSGQQAERRREKEKEGRANDIYGGHFFDEIESGRAKGREMIGREG